MNFLKIVCLLALFSGSFFKQSAQAQENNSVAAWYKNYLLKHDTRPVEDLLKEMEDNRLAAMEIQDDSAFVFLLLETGMIHLTYGYNNEKAMDYFLRSLGRSDSVNLMVGRVFSYLSIARLFELAGNYEKNLQFLERAYEGAEGYNQPEVTLLVLNALGKSCTANNLLNDALEYYNQVLEYKDHVNDIDTEAEALYNLANLYVAKREFNTALDYYKRSLGIRRNNLQKKEEGVLLNEIGTVYNEMNNPERAYANYKAALEVYTSIDYKKGIAEAYNNIGVHYYQAKNYKQALANLELALATGRSTTERNSLSKSYEYLSLTLKALDDFKSALYYREQWIEWNEFLLKEANDQKLLEAQSGFIVNQKETEIDRLEQVRKERERELVEQKRLQQYLYVFIGLGVIIILLTLYLYLLKRRSNKHLQLINQTIEVQNAQLQQLNATKDKFFSIIGHDIKGPLNSLTSFSNLLINHFEALSKDDIQTVARDLDKSLKNLFTLLNNLLEWARSQTGNIDFNPEPFDIVEVLGQNRDLLQTQASAKEITILHEQVSPLMVYANQQSVTTVVRNLISNAIKFTPSNGVIKLSAEQKGNEVLVSVADTGVGMSKAVVDKLFKLDSKHSTPGTANEKGTGLGLILCKDFVVKNGGRLWVESEEGKGSVFYFTINISSGSSLREFIAK